jgi:hypothetical protein
MIWTLKAWDVWIKIYYLMGRSDPKKKKSSFSISYESLFTMFPHLWINEIKNQRGENIWGK